MEADAIAMRSIDKQPVDVGWKRQERHPLVLFVDDDRTFLELCERRFSESDYIVRTAGSADEALRMMASEPVDVVVSDLCMPGTNGAQLMEEVERKHPGVIRMIVSGKFDIADTIDAINRGHIHQYIVKPFNDKDLKLMLYQALLRRERDREEERRRKERQNNVKRRAREIGGQLVKAKAQVNAAYEEVLDLLAAMAGSEHDSVPDVALKLADECGFKTEAQEQLAVAATLRRIGALGGNPDPDPLPARSAKLIGRLRPYRDAARIVSCLGERHDGSGRPLGLEGNEIPQGAQVIALAVDYVALREAGKSGREAVSELGCGRAHDPALLRALAAVIG